MVHYANSSLIRGRVEILWAGAHDFVDVFLHCLLRLAAMGIFTAVDKEALFADARTFPVTIIVFLVVEAAMTWGPGEFYFGRRSEATFMSTGEAIFNAVAYSLLEGAGFLICVLVCPLWRSVAITLSGRPWSLVAAGGGCCVFHLIYLVTAFRYLGNHHPVDFHVAHWMNFFVALICIVPTYLLGRWRSVPAKGAHLGTRGSVERAKGA